MRRPVEALIIAVVATSGCVGSSATTAQTARPPEPQLASFSPSPTGSLDTRPEVRPGTLPVAVLVDDDGTGIHLRARPIDPVTLADIPGYAPISFDHHYLAAVAPGGGTIAAILWPSGSANSGATVHLIDALRWTDRVLPLRIDTYTTPLHFDEHGSAAYWMQPPSSAPAEATTALWRLDIASAAAREVARIPAGMSARDVLPFGDRVAIFAQPFGDVTVDGARRDAPSVFVVDPATGTIVKTVTIPIRAGQYPDSAAADPSEPWRTVTPGLAWDLSQGRLFVADAESERIYRVDLRNGTLSGPFEPQPRRSLLDVVWSLLGGSIAVAKLNAASRQQAVVSPDGMRLYVAGSRTSYTRASDGSYREDIVPLDLRVIDTTDMSEFVRRPAASGPLWIGPDGSTLVYGTSRYDGGQDHYPFSDFKIHITDAAAMKDRGLVDVAGDPAIVSFDRAGSVAYVSWTAIVSSTLDRATLAVIDLRSGKTLGRREMERHYADVLYVAPP